MYSVHIHAHEGVAGWSGRLYVHETEGYAEDDTLETVKVGLVLGGPCQNLEQVVGALAAQLWTVAHYFRDCERGELTWSEPA